jgi:hypothetical protein
VKTVIFVEEPSTVTIGANHPRDAKAVLYRYKRDGDGDGDGEPAADVRPPEPAVGEHQLERGIYLIVSQAGLAVHGVRGAIEVIANNKDDWPDPRPNLVALEPKATVATVQEFLAIAKDMSLDG